MLDYIPPQNAVEELLAKVPESLRPIINAAWKQRDKQSFSDPDAESWPSVPYHYGQGRIKAYEDWVASLSKDEQEREIAACRSRYETYYERMVSLLALDLNAQGHDISEYLRPSQSRQPNRDLDRGLER